MQNKYVGDIGDFGKYALLRALCLSGGADGGPKLSLGVVWYLVPDDDRKGDGSLTEYPSLERCDPDLFKQLQEIVENKERDVKRVREKGVLPPGTEFYEEQLTFERMRRIGRDAREARLARRRQWLDEALKKTARCDMVFVDPDIGLKIRSVKPHHTRGPQYAFFEELKRLATSATAPSPSLVIYQHMNHREKVERQIQNRLAEIDSKLNGYASPFALQFRTSRFFFVVPAKAHRSVLLERAQRLTKKPWDEHFKIVPLHEP